MTKRCPPKQNDFVKSACLTAFLLFGLPLFCAAQQDKVDVASLLRDTQQTENANRKMTIVWWIPDEFWSATFAQNTNVTEKQKEEFLKVVKPYILIAVVKAEFGLFGGATYQPEESVRRNLVLLDGAGGRHTPIDADDISSDLQNFLSMMRPVLVNMLGQMGKNFNFYVFSSNDKNGRRIASARDEGSFAVQSGETKFRWHLPLGSLLAQKTCPKCGEKLSGAFKFCPYDGTSLAK